MASPPSFRISPETLFGPTDLFLPIVANPFVTILVRALSGRRCPGGGEAQSRERENFIKILPILMEKGSPELARCICGMLRSQPNTEE
jgi:hypothetical protein